MKSVSSRIWTRVAVTISYNDNQYTTGTSIIAALMTCSRSSRLAIDKTVESRFFTQLVRHSNFFSCIYCQIKVGFKFTLFHLTCLNFESLHWFKSLRDRHIHRHTTKEIKTVNNKRKEKMKSKKEKEKENNVLNEVHWI